MNRWQTIAVTTGVVSLLSAGTALAVGVSQDGSQAAAGTRAGSAVAGPAAIVQAEDRKTPSARPTPTTSTKPMAKPKVSADAAARIAVAKVGGGHVDEIERELEHGRWEWKVEVIRSGVEYDVRVDAQTGAITRFRADGRDDDRSDDRSDDRDDTSGHGDDRGDHDSEDRVDDNSGPGSGDDRDDRHDD
ncbi:PepSY domain-containing protein [Flindersiella endophytica]